MTRRSVLMSRESGSVVSAAGGPYHALRLAFSWRAASAGPGLLSASVQGGQPSEDLLLAPTGAGARRFRLVRHCARSQSSARPSTPPRSWTARPAVSAPAARTAAGLPAAGGRTGRFQVIPRRGPATPPARDPPSVPGWRVAAATRYDRVERVRRDVHSPPRPDRASAAASPPREGGKAAASFRQPPGTVSVLRRVPPRIFVPPRDRPHLGTCPAAHSTSTCANKKATAVPEKLRNRATVT